ncbi:metallophosphoesterase, partial [candidate division KSB1 bacterium]|nr:metallophosphoesterase [candidate division KSB1 bacterium]
HTHGGGIVGHFWGMPLTPSRFETRYFRGFFAVDQLKLVVTNGIGNTLSPLRYHAPAEVTILNLGEGRGQNK